MQTNMDSAERQSNASQTILFGQLPVSEMDNTSTVMHLSKSSFESDDGDGIQVSDLDEDSDDHVKAKNEMNNRHNELPPYRRSANASETVAVIDIDGVGKYPLFLFYFNGIKIYWIKAFYNSENT